MCDRNDGNIQHLTNCRRRTDDSSSDICVSSQMTFVSHPSDFVIECQTVDVETSEQDGNSAVFEDDENESDADKISQPSRNQSTINAQSLETDIVEVAQHERNTFNINEVADGNTEQSWEMDDINIRSSINEQYQPEIGEDKQFDKIDEPDKLVINYHQYKSEIEMDSNNKDISERENIEIIRKKCSETNGFLSEYISFHDKQAEKVQLFQSDKPQKRTKRNKKLPKAFATETNNMKHKRGTKKLKKNVKVLQRKAKSSSKKASLSISPTCFKTESAISTENTVEEVKKNTQNDKIDYIDTQVISDCNSSNNVPCPITYRYIINHITKDESCILEWCHKVGLIPAEVQCECGSWKEIQMAKDKPLGLIRKCPRCKMRTSVLKGTWFESSHLSIAQIIELTYMWIYRLPQTYVQHELSTSSHHTTGDWYLYCREVCAVILQKTSEKLGGAGKIVEVGETKVGKKKYNMGRLLEGQWILGGIERNSRKMFVVSVKDKDITTFFSVIKEWVNPGTYVIAEYAKSYPFQNDERLRMFTATYDINFIHTNTSPHGQSMNNRWKQRNTGDSRKEFPNTYFLEYMYRVKYSNTDDLFLTFVNHLSLVYPGK